VSDIVYTYVLCQILSTRMFCVRYCLHVCSVSDIVYTYVLCQILSTCMFCVRYCLHIWSVSDIVYTYVLCQILSTCMFCVRYCLHVCTLSDIVYTYVLCQIRVYHLLSSTQYPKCRRIKYRSFIPAALEGIKLWYHMKKEHVENIWGNDPGGKKGK